MGSTSQIVWKNSMASYCLSTAGNRIGNGVKIQLWHCDRSWSSSGQKFNIEATTGWESPHSGRIKIVGNPDYCVVIDGDRYQKGTHIQLWQCDDTNKNQVWSFGLSGQIIFAGDAPHQDPMCLVIDGNNAFDGAKIQLWSCAAGNADPQQSQQWIRLSLGEGRFAYASPDDDKSCAAPFEPMTTSSSNCAIAAEALRPGSGCTSFGGLTPWAQLGLEIAEPSWPKGCMFYAACNHGCGLDFNPHGTGSFCPHQGDGMAIEVICQLPLSQTFA